ncbi:DEAD/DEAH box helicase [Candidatus Pacearchaeota archaeon]|nr:MAG: DEAD/DEAH box helicase [Candidatus Pacearchaeota archaeon]
MVEIIINENFHSDFVLDRAKKKSFSSEKLFRLKLGVEELNNEQRIDRLISWDIVKKNLDYHLPHQKEGALRLLRDHNATAILADEVGLGKTITAGLVIKEGIIRGFLRKVLVLVPPSLVNQWVFEMKSKFEIDFNVVESPEEWKKSDFLIASIDRVKNLDRGSSFFKHREAHKISWDLVVVDEAHKLKERGTLRWRFVDRLQKKRFLLLTATPFQNDLIELYNLLNILKRGHLGTLREFKKRFLLRGNKRHPLNAGELKQKLNEIMIRRKRKETGIEYKRRIPRIISVEMTKEEKVIYENIVYLLKEGLLDSRGRKIDAHLSLFSILPKITSSSRSAIESLKRIKQSPIYHSRTRNLAEGIIKDYELAKKDSKIEKLISIIEEIKKRGDEKAIIYTRHPATLMYIKEKLSHLNLRIVEFVGGLSREEKSSRINDFRDFADILISTDTGAEGLNFQFCRNLINYDLPWNPMAVEQRIGRIDRIGQKQDMFIYSLATKDTMEEYVVDLIINKMCCVGLVIGELPIILFNLGLDESIKGDSRSKIEERLMRAFIDSKGNLETFSRDVEEIAEMISRGIREYQEEKRINEEFLA